jgi:lysophospholipase L1-like esterase
MSGPRDRLTSIRETGPDGHSHGQMARPGSRESQTGRAMAHRTRSVPTGLLGRIRAAIFPGSTSAEAAPSGFDPAAHRGRSFGDAPHAAAAFGSEQAAEIARLDRRHRAIAKVNARAEQRGGMRFEAGKSGIALRGRGSRAGLPFGVSHMREIAAVMAMIVVAGALSAGLPGVSAAVPGSSPTAAVTMAKLADTTIPPGAAPTDSPTPEPSPPDLPTAAPNPAPPKAPTKAPTKPAVARVYKFVALGDSLTAWPAGSSWPTRLDAVDAHLTLVHNAGVPGDTTAMMLARMDRDVIAYHPDVVFVMGGTNDLGHDISMATTIQNLRAIIVKAKAAGIGVFMLRVPPISWLGQAAAIDALNAQIFQLAYSYKVVTIDVHTPLTNSAGAIQSRYTIDGIHFTALGAQTVANTVYNRIKGSGY